MGTNSPPVHVCLNNGGLGRPDGTWVLNRFILWPTVMTCGEIALVFRAMQKSFTERPM
jgi:hypothetical protein